MARLVYIDQAGFEQTFSLDRGSRVTVGRHPDCVIQTTNASVSRRHCTIDATPTGFELSDLGSSSGTYINQQRISTQVLQDGDKINCGSFVLEFLDEPQPTIMLRGRLVYYDDQGAERSAVIGEEQRRVTVGRSAECTVRTADTSVSRLHSEFLYSNGQVEVVDLESFNGTYVNNEKVSRQIISPNDQISCGRLTFAFYIEEEGVPRQQVSAPTPSMPQPSRSNQPPVLPATSGRSYGSLNSGASAIPSGNAFTATNPPPPPSRSQPLPQERERLGSLEAEREELRRELDSVRAELHTMRGRNDELRRELDSTRDSTRDNEERVRELERDMRHKQMDMEALRDRYTDLKDQCDRYEDQLDQKRAELQQKREENERVNYQLAEIQQQHDRGNNQVAHYIEENARLKSEITQLQRKADEYRRQAESQEYDLKKAQQELDDLRRMINREGQSNSNLQGDMDKLRLVLEEKETALRSRDDEISILRADLQALREDAQDTREADRLRGELDYHKDQVRELEAEVKALHQRLEETPSTSEADLQDLRLQLRDVLQENQALQKRLRDVEKDAQESGDHASRINELKREKRDLRHQVEGLEAQVEQLRAGAGANAGGGDAEALERENRELRQRLEDAQHDLRRSQERPALSSPANGEATERLQREVQRLQQELDTARRGAAPRSGAGAGGDGEAIRDRARAVYTAVNDPVSQMRNDLQTAEDFARDLRRLIEAYRRIDLNALSALDRVRIEDTTREVDPDFALDELLSLLASSAESTSSMKEALRIFRREVLR